MCNTVVTVVTNIISVKTIEEDETGLRMYYLNDGYYGSFFVAVEEGIKYPPSFLKVVTVIVIRYTIQFSSSNIFYQTASLQLESNILCFYIL